MSLLQIYRRYYAQVRNHTCLLVALGCFIVHGFSQISPTGDTSIIRLADPTIFQHDNKFYLYGTVGGNANKGFLVYISDDLQKWVLSRKNDGYALRKDDVYGTAGFWAPHVFYYRKKFYMAYTANENIAIASADHPAGPFRQVMKQPLSAPVKQIDPFVFLDDDGKKYLYHVRLNEGNRIYVAEMNHDFTSIKTETLHECIAATETWENSLKAGWPVAEGPSIIKRNETYYLFYSANDFRNPDYAVGYATSKHPLGPWNKHPGNPILNKNAIGHNGPGHGDFLLRNMKLYYVFHTHNSDSAVSPRKTALIEANFENSGQLQAPLRVTPSSFKFLYRSN